MIDPRICRTQPPWDHLSLSGVEEFARLWRKLVGDSGLTPQEQTRLQWLSARRVRPQYELARKGAA